MSSSEIKVRDFFEWMKSIAPSWVHWPRTVDQLLFGNLDSKINGIGVGWMPTLKNLQKTYEMGANLYITHEPLYVAARNKYDIFIGGAVHSVDDIGKIGIGLDLDDPWIQKYKWLKDHKMNILRCHDTWDDFPDIGIHGAWAKFLGFKDKPIATQKYYEVHSTKNRRFGEIVKQISEAVKSIGQDVVHYIGDLNSETNSIAFGTGAITYYRIMHNLGADVLILTDDGIKLWEVAQWAEDGGFKLIIVNHATAEEPGVREMARFFKKNWPELNIFPIERGCLYKSYYYNHSS